MAPVNANIKALIVAGVAAAGVGLVGGCASTTHETPKMTENLVWTSTGEEERPNWALAAEAEETASGGVQFVGISDRHSTQRGARDAALTDARRNVTQYVETQIKTEMESEEVSQNLRDEIENSEITTERITREVSRHAVRGMNQLEWRYEQWGDPKEEDAYFMAFTLVEVGADALELQDFLSDDGSSAEKGGGE